MKRLLTSWFGLGFLPLATGTWGSMFPTAVYVSMCYFRAPIISMPIVMTSIALVACVVCVLFAPTVIEKTGKEDPKEIVVDEVAGQAITFMGSYAIGPRAIVVTAFVGFMAFRIFDIWKPFLIRKAEKLPKGWGILADDLLAGLHALIILRIFSWFWLAGWLNWLGLPGRR